MRRTSSALQEVDEEAHWDAAMRQAVQRESVDLLRHQIEVERGAQASMQRTDFLVALGVVGLSLGVGLGTVSLPAVPGKKKKRRSRRE